MGMMGAEPGKAGHVTESSFKAIPEKPCHQQPPDPMSALSPAPAHKPAPMGFLAWKPGMTLEYGRAMVIEIPSWHEVVLSIDDSSLRIDSRRLPSVLQEEIGEWKRAEWRNRPLSIGDYQVELGDRYLAERPRQGRDFRYGSLSVRYFRDPETKEITAIPEWFEPHKRRRFRITAESLNKVISVPPIWKGENGIVQFKCCETGKISTLRLRDLPKDNRFQRGDTVNLRIMELPKGDKTREVTEVTTHNWHGNWPQSILEKGLDLCFDLVELMIKPCFDLVELMIKPFSR
jgi:hypothetical protein